MREEPDAAAHLLRLAREAEPEHPDHGSAVWEAAGSRGRAAAWSSPAPFRAEHRERLARPEPAGDVGPVRRARRSAARARGPRSQGPKRCSCWLFGRGDRRRQRPGVHAAERTAHFSRRARPARPRRARPSHAEGRRDRLSRLPDALRAAGEVHDQRAAPDAGDGPREHPVLRVRAARRIYSPRAIPGASRSMTARVASGVTSEGANPVPPVVNTRSQASASQKRLSARGDQLSRSPGTRSVAAISAPSSSGELRQRGAALVLFGRVRDAGSARDCQDRGAH